MRLLFATAVLALSASPVASQGWLLETVPTDDISHRSSIAVDANHVPHIAATKWYDGTFYYHSRTAGGWVREEITRHYGGVGSGRAIRLDENGFARIIIEGQIALQGPGGWTMVNAPGGYNWWQAMAIDSDGASRVAYIWSLGSGAYTGGFAYEQDALAPNAFLPTSPSCEMEFDSDGNLYLVAMLNLGQPIQYWRHSQNDWFVEDIGEGAWPSIALDASGRLNVCYYAWPSRDLVHAVRTGADQWTTTPVDTDGDVGVNPSLVIDSSGQLNVSYYDATNKDLRFARRSGLGMQWTTTTVYAVGDVGKYSSLAMDGSTVHISFNEAVDENSSRLHYAQLTGPLTAVSPQPALPRISVSAIPNPFNPSTSIEYVVPVRGRVQVAVFDATGRVVEKLVNEDRTPGTYRVRYRARSASGVYFARVDVGGQSATTKLVLLK